MFGPGRCSVNQQQSHTQPVGQSAKSDIQSNQGSIDKLNANHANHLCHICIGRHMDGRTQSLASYRPTVGRSFARSLALKLIAKRKKKKTTAEK